MALDNAQFISELSISDPPGTDAVAEGDDHIRTTKRATQQSFPNVNAAVPQTAAQMGQMAIKNEVNTFTQINLFSANQAFDNAITIKQLGTDVTDVHFRNSLNVIRWILRNDSDALNNDFKIQRRNSAGAFVDDPISIDATNGRATFAQIAFFNSLVRIGDGSAVSPSLSFNSSPTDGMFSNAVNQVGFATSSTVRALIKNNGIELMAGQVGAPSYTFIGDNDTGMYQLAANIIGFAAGGQERFRIAGGAVSSIGSNMRLTVSDTAAGSGKFECGVLSDNSAFVQMRTGAGVVSSLFRADSGGLSYTGVSNSGKFGIGTASPARTCDIRGAQGTTPLRVLNLPTSSAGLASGDIWNSSNFMAIVP